MRLLRRVKGLLVCALSIVVCGWDVLTVLQVVNSR